MNLDQMNRRRDMMARLIRTARRGEGSVGTNPLVAAGLVREGELLNAKAHLKFGGEHAEARALGEFDGPVSGGELFCTLEPCVHHGKTGPCVEKIIDSEIDRVVVGHGDPNPAVDGAGIEALLNEGVELEFPLLRAQYRWVNRAYFYNQRAGLPWLEAKLANSADGYLATTTHHSRWLSGPESREYSHRLRSRVDAVAVGAETVRRDDPSLTDRVTGSVEQPAAVIVTTEPETIPLETTLLSDRSESTILVTPPSLDSELENELELRGVTVLRSDLRQNRFQWRQVLPRLLKNGLGRILVEGGGRLVGDLISSAVLNECHLFYCGRFLGDGVKSTDLRHRPAEVFRAPLGSLLEHKKFGDDVYVRRIFEDPLRKNGFQLDPHLDYERETEG